MRIETKEVIVRPSVLTLGNRVTEHDISKAIRDQAEDGWELVTRGREESFLGLKFTGGVTLTFQRYVRD